MKNKNNKMFFTCIGLGVLGVGLFSYDVLLDAKNDSVIYVANSDLTTETVLNKDMFTPVKVSKKMVLPNQVTDIDEVTGKELKGGLLKGEVINKTRLISPLENNENLEIKVEADILTPVEDNNLINLYVLFENDKGKTEVKKLFNSKKVSKKSYTTSTKTETFLTIKVNEDELRKYYDAKEKGKVVVVKLNGLDVNKDKTENFYNPEDVKTLNNKNIKNNLKKIK